jgi:hypothetical protein
LKAHRDSSYEAALLAGYMGRILSAELDDHLSSDRWLSSGWRMRSMLSLATASWMALLRSSAPVEGLMSEMVPFPIAPDPFDAVEFGRVFGQPLDRQPVRTFGHCCACCLADVDRAVIEREDRRLDRQARLRAIAPRWARQPDQAMSRPARRHPYRSSSNRPR